MPKAQPKPTTVLKTRSVPKTKPQATAEANGGVPRSNKGAKTRIRLLESAKSVFEDAGFLEARITDIADRAGLSHGSFYHYFDSKEQIFREVADAQEKLLTEAALRDSDPDTAEPLTEYERIARANRTYFERYRANSKIMGVIEEVSRYDDYVNETRMRRQKHFADRANKSIKRLQKAGVADPNIDSQIAAVALGSMIGRFAELWLVENWANFDFDRAVDQVTRLWANAIGLTDRPVSPKR